MRALGEWLLTAARAAVHLPTRTVVVADLHLGYDRVRHFSGEAVPHRTMRGELRPLLDLFCRESIRRIVIAGDLFEDARRGREQMVEEFQAWLAEAKIDLVGVVPGNHDRGLTATSLPVFADGINLDDWRIVHGDRELPDAPFVQGHEHPCLRWREAAGPCYLFSERRLILPAYSADAAGVNVLGTSGWDSFRAAVICGDTVLDFGEVRQIKRKLTEQPPSPPPKR